ncbi:MAG: hypothetical protein QXV17_04920 [Candidatus Micrarchaeaceae archaeon]
MENTNNELLEGMVKKLTEYVNGLSQSETTTSILLSALLDMLESKNVFTHDEMQEAINKIQAKLLEEQKKMNAEESKIITADDIRNKVRR